jgi:hypothetical protein
VIIGPNGSGKSTVLQALEAAAGLTRLNFADIASFGVRNDGESLVSVKLVLNGVVPGHSWEAKGGSKVGVTAGQATPADHDAVKRIRIFSFDASKIAAAVPVQGTIELASNGGGLAAVLDGIRDEAPEQFTAIQN